MNNIYEILEREFKRNKIFLISLDSKDYREGQKKLLEFSTKNFEKTCYVTVNDPYESIIDSLGTGKSSNIFFIDCVTSTVKSVKPKEDVTFVSSPHALTEISISIKNVLKGRINFLIFDSVSTLLIYENPLTVLKFIHKLILTLRSLKLSVAFIILKKDIGNEVVKDLNMMTDKVLEV